MKKTFPIAIVTPDGRCCYVLPKTAKPGDRMSPEQVLEAERQLGMKSPWHNAAVRAIEARKRN